MMLDAWFGQPAFLFTLLALPIAPGLIVYAYWQRRRGMAQLGMGSLLPNDVLFRPRARGWNTLCLVTGIFLLAIACARPQWGHDPTPPQRTGRDVILVLDLSRSMFAEQPSRRDLAVRALRQLADTFEDHGGNRVSLILFAAQPKLLFPLTGDYDHLRHCLAQIEANDYPTLAPETIVSGTRIGAALKLAVQSCEPERANRPVIVLLSDGDDPASDDEEWLEGVTEAKKKQIRVHTVGIGDPDEAHVIPAGKDRLLFDGQPVRTKLNEQRLQEIARRTGGEYLPAHTERVPLGTLIQYLLDTDAWREEEMPTALLPVYQQRYAWFLLPALLLFMLTMLLSEGPTTWSRQSSNRSPMMPLFSKAPAILAAATAFILIGAAPAPWADEWIRKGNDAFAQQDYEAAVKYYEQAEPMTLDPGLVAFNKAAANYRLGKYRESIEGYRRCLDDDQAPPARRARASFDLGDALLQYAGDDAQLLAQAAAAYRACLRQPSLPAELRADAEHNLDLAQILWLRAVARQPKDSSSGKEDKSMTKGSPPEQDPMNPPTDSAGTEDSSDTANPRGGSMRKPDATSSAAKNSRSLTSGTVQSLPDNDPVVPLAIEDTLTTLENHAQRIAGLRRKQHHPDGPATISRKDW